MNADPSVASQYAADAAAGPTESDLAELSRLVGDMVAAEDEVARLEAQLDSASKRLETISRREIPDLMDRAGTSLYRTKDGMRVEVQRKVRASIPAATRDQAHDWLDDNGHGGLLKRTVEVAFSRQQEPDARALLDRLAETYENVRVQKKVEPSTLTAWVKERLGLGEPVPDELFSVYPFAEARVERPKP